MLTWQTHWQALVKLSFFLERACCVVLIAYCFTVENNISFGMLVLLNYKEKKTQATTASVVSVVGCHCNKKQTKQSKTPAPLWFECFSSIGKILLLSRRWDVSR